MATKTVDANEMAVLFIQTQIDKAQSLLDAKREVLDQIGSMREMLNTLADNGTASVEQAQWIYDTLPKRKRNGAGAEDTDDTTDATSDDEA